MHLLEYAHAIYRADVVVVAVILVILVIFVILVIVVIVVIVTVGVHLLAHAPAIHQRGSHRRSNSSSGASVRHSYWQL